MRQQAMNDGTVRRWDAYVQTEGAELHVDWIEDETGEYVTYGDHKAIVDALRTQARELAKQLVIEIELRCSRSTADIKPQDSPVWLQAQAVLKEGA